MLSGLSETQLEMMMNTEFGGMNEIFVDLYADTGDERWLAMSYEFEHDAFIDPLERHVDNLPGKHGNTAMPEAARQRRAVRAHAAPRRPHGRGLLLGRAW